MRAALHGILREGREEAYEREHAVVWPDLLAALQRAGIREWIIWRSGRDLFHVVEADDFDRAVADLEHDPANERWQAHMAAFVDHFESGPDGAGPRLVWTMSAQGAAR